METNNTLIIMLSTISDLRGLVMGVSLILILGFTLFVEVIPWSGDFMPWNLTAAISATRPAMAVSLVTGQPLPTLVPVFASLGWCLLFVTIAVWRFRKEEF